MSDPAMATPPLPAVSTLLPRQQMGMECALRGRYLGASGRVLGDIRHRGRPFRLWVCDFRCSPNHPQPPAQTGDEI